MGDARSSVKAGFHFADSAHFRRLNSSEFLKLCIGQEHFENPSFRKSFQEAEMTSLAETVSSAIIERHPEIGTLKKINAVKEYIDDGAISKGKSLKQVNVP